MSPKGVQPIQNQSAMLGADILNNWRNEFQLFTMYSVEPKITSRMNFGALWRFNSIKLVVHVKRQWPLSETISQSLLFKKNPLLQTPVSAFLVKHHREMVCSSQVPAGSYLLTHHIRRSMTNNRSPTLYMVSDIRNMLEEVERHHYSICIWTIGSCFPSRGGITYAMCKFKRLHNDIPLYPFKTSLMSPVFFCGFILACCCDDDIVVTARLDRDACDCPAVSSNLSITVPL